MRPHGTLSMTHSGRGNRRDTRVTWASKRNVPIGGTLVGPTSRHTTSDVIQPIHKCLVKAKESGRKKEVHHHRVPSCKSTMTLLRL